MTEEWVFKATRRVVTIADEITDSPYYVIKDSVAISLLPALVVCFRRNNKMTLIQQNKKNRVKMNLINRLAVPIFVLIVYWLISTPAKADTIQSNTTPSNSRQFTQLKVTPKPCVALHKGQKCYLEVTFSWQHPQVSNYCLVNTTIHKTIKCWRQQTKGEFSFDFQSKLNNNFALREQESTTDLALATIPVAWVYKSSKRAKSTWRLF